MRFQSCKRQTKPLHKFFKLQDIRSEKKSLLGFTAQRGPENQTHSFMLFIFKTLELPQIPTLQIRLRCPESKDYQLG